MVYRQETDKFSMPHLQTPAVYGEEVLESFAHTIKPHSTDRSRQGRRQPESTQAIKDAQAAELRKKILKNGRRHLTKEEPMAAATALARTLEGVAFEDEVIQALREHAKEKRKDAAAILARESVKKQLQNFGSTALKIVQKGMVNADQPATPFVEPEHPSIEPPKVSELIGDVQSEPNGPTVVE